jgi:serine/threonine protein kinase
MTVAVKQLQLGMDEWADIRKELREIQFVRTIRHPNILMFIGDGHYEWNRPFLVLEYMGGGALLSLLENAEIPLSRGQRIRFVLNTASGINYLHSLRPPRIHRDLKRANLLLSCTRQVKVADFGFARLIPKAGSPSFAKRTRRRRLALLFNSERGRHCTALEQHLLSETARLTSCHIGTADWRSPELWRKLPYGKATDVYR